MLTLLLPATVNAYDFEVDGIYYNINGNEATVTYKGENYASEKTYFGDVTIPATVTYNGTTYPVTTIGDYSFQSCDSLTSIEIPNSVTTIGNRAFGYCTLLSNIDIPNSVTTIGLCAFNYCYSLTRIDIPNSITTFGNAVFAGCTSVSSITVASDNPFFDSRNNCNAIIETASNTLITGCINTVIPNSVTAIGRSAFSSCTNLVSIDIPNSVTAIGNGAFKYCSKLTSINIPSGVASIGDEAFRYCNSLNELYSYVSDPLVITMGTHVFEREPTYYNLRTLHVPFGSAAAYQAHLDWKYFFGTIVEMDSVLAESIKLNVTTAGLNEGSTLQLTATVQPEECDNKTVIWASSDEAVATVDSNGLVTTHSVGTATITAMTTDGSNLNTTCTVTLLPVGIKGDVNGDNNINISDVTKLIDYLLSGTWN